MTSSQASGSRGSRRRISGFEVLGLCVVVAAAAVFATSSVIEWRLQRHLSLSQPALAELEPLRKYGPNHFSREFEEWIVRDYFQDRRDGVFLDVGANHYQQRSNTYFLEASLGWSGIAVDPLEEFAADYKIHRPRTRFVAMFASDRPDETVQFFVPENNLVSSSNRDFTVRYGAAGKPRDVPTTTLTAVLDQAGIKKLDFMSMDIELAEPKALAGFDIDRFQPAFVCIESHPEIRQQILDYFDKHGYVVVGKYLRVDVHNLYFRPRTQ